MRAKYLFISVLAVALLAATQRLGAEEVVAQFSGKSNGNTREFRVNDPWLVDWLVSGRSSHYESVNIALINADTGSFEGTAVATQSAGNGVRLFNQGGRYYFRVNAKMMNWKIKVIQLTPTESRQYKPRQ